MTKDWQTIAKQKRQSIIDAIPSEWRLSSVPTADEQKDVTGQYVEQFLSNEEVEVTRLDAEHILQKTTTGKWTAEKVAKAFAHRAALAHQLVNCLHEYFYETAIRDAKALDAYYKEHGKPVGPLHGFPVSLKDQFHICDVETSMGYIGWLNTFQGESSHPSYLEHESLLVQYLRSLGAVLYVKTAVPLTLMTGETVNNIIDYVWNPSNRYLSAGGSSGGEGALLALRGSVLGVGSDIGGSVRMPAAFNGVWSIRPSSGRVPYLGVANSMDGQISVPSVLGPLSTSLAGCKLFMEAVLSCKPWLDDPNCFSIPWRSEPAAEISSSDRKLTFGILWTDGQVQPQPPVTRALSLVASALRAAGHEVIDWAPPSHKKILDATTQAYLFDGGRDVNKAFGLSGEPIPSQLNLVPPEGESEATATDIMATNITLREARAENMAYWNSTKDQTESGRVVDAVISPVCFTPAVRRDGFLYYGYSVWVNGMDYSSVVLPVTKVDKEVDGKNEKFEQLSELDGKCQALYDPEVYHGTPVGLQIVGRKHEEEKMVDLAAIVHEILKERA